MIATTASANSAQSHGCGSTCIFRSSKLSFAPTHARTSSTASNDSRCITWGVFHRRAADYAKSLNANFATFASTRSRAVTNIDTTRPACISLEREPADRAYQRNFARAFRKRSFIRSRPFHAPAHWNGISQAALMPPNDALLTHSSPFALAADSIGRIIQRCRLQALAWVPQRYTGSGSIVSNRARWPQGRCPPRGHILA